MSVYQKVPILLTFSWLFLLSSCQEVDKSLLCKKWKTVWLQNRKSQLFLDSIQHEIDTLDRSVRFQSAQEREDYRTMLQSTLNQIKEEQRSAFEQTLIEFQPNGVSLTTSPEGTSTAKYEVEDHRYIRLDESAFTGVGTTMTMEILKLTKDTLQLRFIDMDDTSTAIMKPVQ